MRLRNGQSFNPQDRQQFQVVDKNIVRHKGMNRLSPKTNTPFQQLLTLVQEFDFKLNESQLDSFLKIIFRENNSSSLMHTLSNKKIIACYNDNAKRFFDSVLAKKILNYLLQNHSPSLKVFTDEFKQFLKEQYQDELPLFLNNWNSAVNGQSPHKDENLSSFAGFKESLKALVSDGHFTDGEFLLNLYDHHYLTHPLAKLEQYKRLHPNGGFKSYLRFSTYYSDENRGRVTGYGFNVGNPSHHLGIFRSIDQTPYDMRIGTRQAEITRCPDRLYMSHPKTVRNKTLNYMHIAFSNKYNSCYVNGLSGSILLEINALLYYVICIQQGLYKPKGYKYSDLSSDNFQLPKEYLLLMLSIFVYFEGGHCLNEILGTFELPIIKENFKNIFNSQNDFNINTLILNNKDIKCLLKEALIETAQFSQVLDNKRALHQQITKKQLNPSKKLEQTTELPSKYSRKLEVINQLLKDFENEIESAVTLDSTAERAKELLIVLRKQVQIAFKYPSPSSMENFYRRSRMVIKQSIAYFQNDLNWGDYLLNMLKEIANTVISLFNKADPNRFYKATVPLSLDKVDQLQYDLDLHLNFR